MANTDSLGLQLYIRYGKVELLVDMTSTCALLNVLGIKGSPGVQDISHYDWTNCHYVVTDIPFTQGAAMSVDLASNILPRPIRLSKKKK